MKKSISIFVPTLAAGGAEKQAAILAKTLSAYCSIHLVALYGDIQPSKSIVEIIKDSPVQIHLIRGSFPSRYFCYAKILKSNKVEISFNYLTKCDFIGAILERICGVKFVYNGIRNTKLEKNKVVLEWLSHQLFVTGTILNCHSGLEEFGKLHFNMRKMFVIPNCFLNIHEPLIRDDKEIKSIITVGRFHPQKDYLTAIKTVSLLKNTRSDFKFIIVGYGSLENQIREWVNSYGLQDIVEIHINPPYIPMLLKESDIYLSTSLFEGTSNSIMEAMNYSLPIVATDVGDNCYLVENGGNGYLHTIGNTNGLAESITKLLSNYEMRKTMGICSNKVLKDSYSADTFLRYYLNIVKL